MTNLGILALAVSLYFPIRWLVNKIQRYVEQASPDATLEERVRLQSVIIRRFCPAL